MTPRLLIKRFVRNLWRKATSVENKSASGFSSPIFETKTDVVQQWPPRMHRAKLFSSHKGSIGFNTCIKGECPRLCIHGGAFWPGRPGPYFTILPHYVTSTIEKTIALLPQSIIKFWSESREESPRSRRFFILPDGHYLPNLSSTWSTPRICPWNNAHFRKQY